MFIELNHIEIELEFVFYSKQKNKSGLFQESQCLRCRRGTLES